MGSVVLENLWKVYKDGTQAIKGVSLEIEHGEFFVFLGPSGCGKTTLLRTVAGLEEPTHGRVLINDTDVTDRSPKDRNVAMVFQQYSLYPHMNVYDNIAFGISGRRLKKNEIDERVRRTARILDIDDLLNKRPRALSGGQQQRVAMGRAIVREPEAYLMDEPLSNLDARTRIQIRGEIARIQGQVGVTTLYVTHDQTEAMTLGDRVGVLREGVLQQVAPPSRLYRDPDNLFVAGFVGSPPMNLAEATLEEADDGLFVRFSGFRLRADEGNGSSRERLRSYAWRQVVVGVRPEDLEDPVTLGAPESTRMRITVGRREHIGADHFVYFMVDAPLLLAEDPRDPATDKPIRTSWPAELPNEWMARISSDTAADELIELAVRPGRLHVFDPRTGEVISP